MSAAGSVRLISHLSNYQQTVVFFVGINVGFQSLPLAQKGKDHVNRSSVGLKADVRLIGSQPVILSLKGDWYLFAGLENDLEKFTTGHCNGIRS